MKKIIALVLLVITIIIYPTIAEAKEYSNKDTLINVTLENGPQFYPGSNIKIKMEFDLTHQEVEPNDTLVLDLPENLEIDSSTEINFMDGSGHLLATGKVVQNKIVITFTENVRNKQDVHGFIDISLKMKPDTFPLGKNIIEFETKNGLIPIEIEVQERKDDISKKGKLIKLADGTSAIRWTMVVNRNNLKTTNMILSDVIKDEELTYIEGSTKVYIGEWVDLNKSAYKRRTLLTEGVDYKREESLDGVTLFFNEGTSMYVVDLLTKPKNPQLLDKTGVKFNNTAHLMWTDEEGKNSSSSVSSNFVIRDKNSGIDGSDKQPVEPEQPTEPEQPVEPEQPTEPEQPVEPKRPTDSSNLPKTEKNSDIKQLIKKTQTIKVEDKKREESSNEKGSLGKGILPRTGEKPRAAGVILGLLLCSLAIFLYRAFQLKKSK
ncbi:Ig-like domain-containing protein [Lactococcus garvieae]|uniref:Ig-like domain-containing protein n=1 Tax=Lactococcus garvieae TaxID=1363 RepID=UPI00254F6626|nr:Ig-like domain-containing protein [Lactococcus garvieae]